MKKRSILLLTLMAAVVLSGCGEDEKEPAAAAPAPKIEDRKSVV